MLEKVDNGMRNFVNILGKDQAILTDMVEWTQDVSKLNEVVSWLGFHESCHFQKLLEFNTHGYSNGNTEVTPHPDCKKLTP